MSGVDTVIQSARAQIGKPYVFGQDGPSTFDCSGLITYVFGMIGVSLPHNAAAQQRSAQVRKVSSPQPGDLVFYGNPAHHVALYVGGGMQIAAPHTGAKVSLQKVSSGATYGRVLALGLANNPVAAAISNLAGNTGASVVNTSFNVDDFFGQVEGVGITLAFGAVGLALAGAGVFLLVSKRGKRIVSSIT